MKTRVLFIVFKTMTFTVALVIVLLFSASPASAQSDDGVGIYEHLQLPTASWGRFARFGVSPYYFAMPRQEFHLMFGGYRLPSIMFAWQGEPAAQILYDTPWQRLVAYHGHDSLQGEFGTFFPALHTGVMALYKVTELDDRIIGRLGGRMFWEVPLSKHMALLPYVEYLPPIPGTHDPFHGGSVGSFLEFR